jgi:F-type H+-transporting ATPase subunit a
MGEESTWFDYLPGLQRLTELLKHYLGREDETQSFFFRAGPFGESHFTLTHVLAVLLVLAFVTVGAMSFKGAMDRGGEQAIVPPSKLSLRNLFEMLGDALWNLTKNIMGEPAARRYLPFIGALASFIFFSNVLALIPGMIPPTSTLKTNVALALTVFVLTHIEGIRAQGIKSYLAHFAGPIWWLAWLMIPIELISHLARPLSLSLRLMGNMVSDHKVVSMFFALVPLLVPVPFLILGTLVAVIQTLVFCLLTMVYLNMAVSGHDHDEHEGHDHGHADKAHAHAHA